MSESATLLADASGTLPPSDCAIDEPTPLAAYDGSKDPFINRTHKLSLYNKLKFIFPGLLVAIPRLAGIIGCLSAAAERTM